MNWKRIAVGSFGIVLGASLVCGAGKLDGRQLHQMTLDYRTPHLDWGFDDNREVGKLRVLFVVPRKSGREVAELVQRLPVAQQTVVAFNEHTLAKDSIYEAMADGTSQYAKERELLGRLEDDCDVVVLGNVVFQALPPAAQYRILSLVREGAALLLFHGAGARRLPFKKLYAEPIDTADFLAGYSPAPRSGGKPPAKPSPLLEAWRFGKGMIVQIPYKDGGLNAPMALTPAFAFDRSWQANYESAMAMVMRAVLWAAPDSPMRVRFGCPELAGFPEIGPEGREVAFTLAGDGADQAALVCRIRDAFNQVVAEETIRPASGTCRFRVPALPGGRYSCDVRVRRGDQTVGVGLYAFAVESVCGDLQVVTDGAPVYDRTPIEARVNIGRPLDAPGELRVRLLDSPKHKTWHRQTVAVPAGASSVVFRVEHDGLPSIAGHLVCELADARGRVLGQAGEIVYFPDYTLPDYLNFGWETLPEGMGPLRARPTIETLGWGIALTHPVPNTAFPRAATMLNQRWVVYTTRIGLQKSATGGTRQYRWFSRDKADQEAAKALGDDQCFYRPEVRALWRRDILNRIDDQQRHSPVIYSLGDENNFSYEAGYGPSDLTHFRAFLQRKYVSVEALNREWGRTYNAFDEVPHPPLEEARAATNYAAWFDHRQYMEGMYADVHHFCREVIREYDPRAVVGAEGSVPGDMELTFSKLDFWGPYSRLVEDEVLRSLGGDKIRTHWWGGLNHAPGILYPQQLDHVLKGSVNGSAWYTTTCGSVHSAFAVDYSLPEFVQDYLPSMNLLRDGVAQLLIANPLHDDGVRFFWSHASNTAKLLDPRFVSPSDGLTTLIQAAYRENVNFDFVSERTLARLADPKARILFLCGVSALSDAAAQAIMAFAERGGTVVADLNCGLLNDYLRIREENPLRDLFGPVVHRGLPAPERLPVVVETTFAGVPLSLRAAKALTTPGAACFQVRPVGRGRGVLLNFGLSSAVNTADAATPITRFLTGLLEGAGVARPHPVEAAPDGTMVRVRDGRGFSLVGVRIPDREVAAKPVCRITLPAKGYVYRCDRGYLGAAERLTGDFDGTPFNLFAVFPGRQQPPRVPAPGRVAPGGVAKLDLSAIPEGRIIRVRVTGPDGAPMADRHQVLNRDRAAECLLRFAWDDPEGTYDIRVADVATGLSTRCPLQVRR